jgi:hypothetical protein
MQNNPTISQLKQNNETFYNEFIDDDENSWYSRPDEWNDDVRMNALFTAFRNRDLNPLFYDSKLKFWKETILSYCNEKELMQFDLSHLESCFMRKGKKPKCLDLVLSELMKEKTLVTRDEALKPKPGLIKNILNKFIWSPLSFTTSYILKQANLTPMNDSKSTLTPTKQSSFLTATSPNSSFSSPTTSRVKPETSNADSLVFLNLVENKSQRLLKHLQDTVVVYRNIDTVIEYEKLCDIYMNNISGQSAFTQSDFELVLKYLEVNQKCLVNQTEFENKTLVKFALSMNGYVAPITQIESSYQNLKYTEKKLEDEINKFSNQIEVTNEAIKSYLKQQQKNTALKLLKKRKQLEKSLQSKDETLANIQAMMSSIQQADTNQLTFDVYSKSAEALKEANKNIKIDKVDETMADIQDALSTQAEMEDVLKSPVGYKYANIDDSELDLELDELIAEQNAKSKLPSFSATKLPSSKVPNVDTSFNMDEILESLNSINVPSNSPTISNVNDQISADNI